MEPTRAFIANRLPVQNWPEEGTLEANPKGGLARAGMAVLKEGDLYIGAEKTESLTRRTGDIRRISGQPFEMLRVLVEKADYDGYYGFANRFLWPLMHLTKQRLDETSVGFPRPEFDDRGINLYRYVNQVFANDVAKEVISRGADEALLWVHDYHLMNLPNILRNDFRNTNIRAKIGQFWHIPWFDPEVAAPIFHTGRPRRGLTDLVDTLFSNDILAFHSDQYVENFRRTTEALGLEWYVSEFDDGYLITLADGRKVQAFSHPIGINVDEVESSTTLEKRLTGEYERINRLMQKNRREGVLNAVGLERLDYTKGILERLDMIEELLKQGVRMQYLGFAQLSRTGVRGYDELRTEVEKRTEEVNRVYGNGDFTPIMLEISPNGITTPANYAFMRDADICMVTTLADGMNLVALEAILSKHDLPQNERGAVVLGECGAAHVLPYGEEDGVLKLDNVLDAERSAYQLRGLVHDGKIVRNVSDRAIRDIQQNRDVRVWGEEFMDRLSAVEYS